MPDNNQRSPDEEAFLRQFMAEERALLRFILRYVPSVTDARDVLQETLVTLWAKRAEFDAMKEFLPWACGIARFKVREFWRKQPRWESFASEDLMALIDARRAVLEPEISARGETIANSAEDQIVSVGLVHDIAPSARIPRSMQSSSARRTRWSNL